LLSARYPCTLIHPPARLTPSHVEASSIPEARPYSASGEYRGYSKLRTHTAVGPYGRSMPRSIGPSYGLCVFLISSNPCRLIRPAAGPENLPRTSLGSNLTPSPFTRVPRLRKTIPPLDPPVGFCLGPYGGPRHRGGGGSYEQGTPVGDTGWLSGVLLRTRKTLEPLE